LHIEFLNYFLYTIGCLAVAGIALGFTMKEYCDYPPLEEVEPEDDSEAESEEGEEVQSDPVEDDPEDGELNIVSYK
ncbi:MAG: hypothetical protein PQJ28_02535, partial [Spirochaetales bacterium]|nr:hypothetical protein [Spirochaetales bacterium]